MDVKFLKEAYRLASTLSDDPLTKNGAVLVNPAGVVIGQGANRLPSKVNRHQNRLERPDKYDYLIHAEQDTIADAAKKGNCTDKSTLYCPWASCSSCARLIIQSGIIKVVTHRALMIQSHGKWPREIEKSTIMFREAGVEFVEYDGKIGGIEHTFNSIKWNP